MARVRQALGSWGEIKVYEDAVDDRGRPIRYRARARFREYNGTLRQVERHGKTKEAARRALLRELRLRSAANRNRGISEDVRFSEVARLWMDRIDRLAAEGRRSPGTAEIYRRQLENHVLPPLGELCLREIDTALLDALILEMKEVVGPSTARTCRSIISGVLGMAVRYGAIAFNPTREVERIEDRAKKRPRALTAEERAAFLAKLDADEEACGADIPDLCRFMLATGVRIGEALAVLWSEVDLAAGVVDISSTIIRVKGVGLIRKDTKSEAGKRMLALPPWAIRMLKERYDRGVDDDEPVFSDSLGGFRDPSNTRRDLRAARDRGGLSWLTSHSFRKTTATILDEAGLSARVVADQLGHARPSMTQDVYMGRSVASPEAAHALGAAFGDDDESVG